MIESGQVCLASVAYANTAKYGDLRWHQWDDARIMDFVFAIAWLKSHQIDVNDTCQLSNHKIFTIKNTNALIKAK